MNKLVFSFILIFSQFLASEVFALVDSYVEMGMLQTNNALYLKDKTSDSISYLEGNLYYEKDGSLVDFESLLKVGYSKYASFTVNDGVDYNLKMDMPINKNGSYQFDIGLGAKNNRNAIVDEINDSSQIIELTEEVTSGLQINFNDKQYLRFDLEFYNHHFNDEGEDTTGCPGSSSLTNDDPLECTNFNYLLANTKVYAAMSYHYWFLPQTRFYIGGKIGQVQYTNPLTTLGDLEADERATGSVNSTYLKGYLGISGKLTPYIKITAEFGGLINTYELSQSYQNEPEFTIKFEDQLSVKDIIVAGYNYTFKDSYFTNWQLSQEIHIGYSRIISDRMVFLMRLAYDYRSFSLPNRREDQRITTHLKLDFALASKWSLSTYFDGDLLVSDVFIGSGATNISNKDASYEKLGLGLSLKRSF